MVRDTTPKPVKVIPARAELKKKDLELVKFIKVPDQKTESAIERLIDFAPYIILKHGEKALLALSNVVPPYLGFILKWTGRAIGYAKKRFSVE